MVPVMSFGYSRLSLCLEGKNTLVGWTGGSFINNEPV